MFAKPDYRPHSTIILTGQVVRPGTYDLDSPRTSLREILARAGGLTPEAMPKAGIFLRSIRPVDPERKRASILAGILAGDPKAEVELQDGDEIIIPRRTDVVYVVGETASPFAAFKVSEGMKVKDVVALAGGYTRNADTWNVRLLKANGKIVDHWVKRQGVEPGDALLVPQRIRRDVNWAEQMAALTPVAILINTFK